MFMDLHKYNVRTCPYHATYMLCVHTSDNMFICCTNFSNIASAVNSRRWLDFAIATTKIEDSDDRYSGLMFPNVK